MTGQTTGQTTGTRPDGTASSHALLTAGVCGAVSVGLLVAITTLADTVPAAVPRPGQVGWWVTLLGLLVQAAVLTAVRARPLTVLVAVTVPAPLLALAGAGDATSVTSLAVVVAVYVAATARPLRALAPALGAVAVLMAAGAVISAHDLGTPLARAVPSGVLQALGTLALVLLLASWVRALRETRLARREQGLAVAREQEALVQAAVARERTDMARELHDIAAHHLTGIAVMAAAVERQIDTDPAGAKVSVQQVRQQSTTVLRDLRSLVGLLREQDPAADARPETLAGIRHLVADVSASGRDVTCTVLGDDRAAAAEVGPLAQLAAYRAVQEALANAARHAPGASCTVTLDARPDDAVVVSVRNARAVDGPAEPTAGGGFGLVGMRERAQLTGATLDVGPTADGGWLVTLHVPREAP